jgi:predicted DNA-binding protein with PD1-like motif
LGSATAAGQLTFAVVFDTGDEVMDGLQAFARGQRLAGSHFSAIGACQSVTLGYFEWETRQYRPIAIEAQVEVLWR